MSRLASTKGVCAMLQLFDNLPIRQKLTTMVVGSVAVLAVAIGSATLTQSSESTKVALEESLTGIAESRRDALRDYLVSIEQDLSAIASNPFTLEALGAFEAGWNALGNGQTQTLQQLYITDNPNPLGSKDALMAANDGSAYSAAHATYHPWFREFLQTRGYYDIFLFSLDGDLVYTVFKELDYATNLRSGQWAGSDLGKAFVQAADRLQPGERAFFDFQPYAPSHGAAASFMATPISGPDGSRAGVLVFQMPVDRLNEVAGSRAGLGETGESFLVGADNLMRTNAPLADAPTLLKTGVSPEITQWDQFAETVIVEADSYNGVASILAAAPLEFNGVQFRVVAAKTLDEAFAQVHALRNSTLLISVLLMLGVGFVGMVLARRVAKPLSEVIGVVNEIVNGSRSVSVPHMTRRDEIGPLAQAIERFKQAMIQSETLAAQAAKDAEAREQRARALTELTKAFESQVGGILGGLGAASSKLDLSAASMMTIADQTRMQSAAVSEASQTASANVQGVAAATEELSVSVGTIQEAVRASQRSTTDAVHGARQMQERVGRLEVAAGSISEVVQLITDIAAQTNLLALNATIEAARAGEAGKGFAVVASEVKALASQTSKATGDIAAQVSEIQTTTQDSVAAIREIMDMISGLEASATEIASTIDQQSSATLLISQNVQEAAQNVQTVDSNIEQVRVAAQESGNAATDVKDASTHLNRQTSQLSEEIRTFLSKVQAA
jgi:methyl-accepting chemotaxis protein